MADSGSEIESGGAGTAPRRRAMSALAAADGKFLADAWETLATKPDWSWLRRPESGLVMVRGRIGGAGSPFNLGEVTVTRCAVSIDSGEAGFSWIMGRDAAKARLAALFDAMWQAPERRDEIEARVVGPALAAQAAADRTAAEETAATRVDFFTMVRGEDEQ
ncbi:phosphonate C-P lyase system protein PhnG [Microbaculum marinum]|uniref:Phosphonate C-P lyase system protein PhnG n=1 Tax=Microbaculum marinum TaxID=1764581 RepID=A0AAW9RRE1_9HYPH